MLISSKNSILTVGIASLLSLSNWALASPSYGISLDLNNWDKIGDVQPITSDQAQANSGTFDAALTGGGGKSLEEFLGINPGSLDFIVPPPPPDISDLASAAGSAIKKTLVMQAGDIFSFNWQLNLETDYPDRAFVTINNLIIPLDNLDSALNGNFQYLFSDAGNYTLGIGIVDAWDTGGESQLIVSNPQLQRVPEPLTILGVFTGLGCGLIMRSCFGKKS